MSRWISKDGIWHPAKEKVALKNITDKVKVIGGQTVQPGEPYIYEGPDRAALFELFEQKVETLGQDFRQDIELINRVKQLGYNSVDDYAKVMGYDKDKVEELFNKHASVVTQHELPDKVKALNELGGGTDMSGQGKSIVGGFGEPEVKPAG
jgi:hypothetical protein